MKIQVRSSTTFFSIGFIISGLIFLAFLFSGYSNNQVNALTEDTRLVTVHDRGQELTFITSKSTLREAFVDNGISIDERDAVEPSLDEELIAPDYQVNIYRARPVTIVDGSTRQRVVTPYQSVERIVADAGLSLSADDKTELSRSDDIVGDGAGLELTIIRAIPVSLDLYGVKTEIQTQAETVGEMLEEKEIRLGMDGRVSLALDTPIYENIEVKIWREGKQTITVTEEIAFATRQIKDADRDVGYEEIQTVGQNGQRTVTYEIEIKDGVEVARVEIASLQLKPATEQVVVVGAKRAGMAYTGGGTKTEWLSASNIDPASWAYADYIVSRESSWNPNAVNASSGACGLAQALPCSKIPGNPYDPVTSLNWMNSYVIGRYGGWEQAYNFWTTNHWY